MVSRQPTIVVTGDVSIDWLAFEVPPAGSTDSRGQTRNWHQMAGTRMIALEGGAIMLAKLVGAAANVEVAAQRLTRMRDRTPDEIIHSLAELAPFPYMRGDDSRKVYRVDRLKGLSGPLANTSPEMIALEDTANHRDADIVVLDDAGNGFRDHQRVWPAALIEARAKPVVIHKMHRPLGAGPLWRLVQRRHAERTISIVNMDDLREIEGIDITRRLSWESTAEDFVRQITRHPKLAALRQSCHLVVRLSADGALHFRGGAQAAATLYYDPTTVEGGFLHSCPGRGMLGLTAAFVAGVTAAVARAPQSAFAASIPEGILLGIDAARELCRRGYGADPQSLSYPGKEIFASGSRRTSGIEAIEVPIPAANVRTAPPWSILESLQSVDLQDVARSVVMDGPDKALGKIPVGRFGGLLTVDRKEIESLRAIRNLFDEYLHNPRANKPLSIAVFGPPGSGKSFAVTEVAKSVESAPIEFLPPFNLAQFQSTDELINTFHKIRDVTLTGRSPLVFFDEFDSEFGGKELGWLKYFLAPMQDGKFLDAGVMHPIGKAIFVFAGGTSDSIAKFSEGDAAEPERIARERAFKAAKGPDFISRLRGHVDILGVNPDSGRQPFEVNHLYTLRRAILLRALLKKNAPQLFGPEGRVDIDAGVLAGLLRAPKYRHGARSMEAIIDMSILAGRRRFEQAALPPSEQLDMHLDVRAFEEIMRRESWFGELRERLGKAIHEKYRGDQKRSKPASDPSMRPWEKLDAGLRESSRQQADDIPDKLMMLGYDFRPTDGGAIRNRAFNRNEIEKLAEREHDRWMKERFNAGWLAGEKRNELEKISPDLVPWKQLSHSAQNNERDAVRHIPALMADAGFEIFRPTFSVSNLPLASEPSSSHGNRRSERNT